MEVSALLRENSGKRVSRREAPGALPGSRTRLFEFFSVSILGFQHKFWWLRNLMFWQFHTISVFSCCGFWKCLTGGSSTVKNITIFFHSAILLLHNGKKHLKQSTEAVVRFVRPGIHDRCRSKNSPSCSQSSIWAYPTSAVSNSPCVLEKCSHSLHTWSHKEGEGINLLNPYQYIQYSQIHWINMFSPLVKESETPRRCAVSRPVFNHSIDPSNQNRWVLLDFMSHYSRY